MKRETKELTLDEIGDIARDHDPYRARRGTVKRLDDIKARGLDAEWAMYSDDDVPVLVAAVEAVLALHKRVGWDNGDCCFDCSDHLGDPILYPCPTVTAIRTALGEEQ